MGLWDSLQSTTPPPEANSTPTPAPAPTGSIWDAVPTAAKTIAPTATVSSSQSVPNGQVTPPADQNQPKVSSSPSIWDAVPTPKGSVKTSAPAPVKSPYFSAVDTSGNSFGFSNLTDASGKPFFAYRAPGDTSTTTDKTRVATTFDPRVAEPLNSKTFLTPRAVANRAALKTAMGGTYSDELDHKIALELAGSNDNSNLQIQPGIKGGAALESDKVETQLAKQVAAGKMSLFDAQTQLAKQKGLDTPFTGTAVHHNILSNTFDSIGKYFDNPQSVGGIIKNTVTGLPAEAADVGHAIMTGTHAALGAIDSVTARPEDTGAKMSTSVAKNTLKELPSSIVENLPLGLGSIVKQLRDDPSLANNENFDSLIKGLPEAGKNFVKGFVADPVLTVAGAALTPFQLLTGNTSGGQIHFNIPGLGEVSNMQYQAAQEVAGGKPIWQTVLDATPNAIFDTLMFVGMTQSFFGPREVSLIKTENPEGVTAKNPPQSFRSYDEPVNQTQVPNAVLDKIVTEKGIDLGKDYDPSRPTFFRLTGQASGNIVGELYQLKPSIASSIWDALQPKEGEATPTNTGILPFYEQKVSLNDIKTGVTGAISKIADTYKEIPNKEGGFIKNPITPVAGENYDHGNTVDMNTGEMTKENSPAVVRSQESGPLGTVKIGDKVLPVTKNASEIKQFIDTQNAQSSQQKMPGMESFKKAEAPESTFNTTPEHAKEIMGRFFTTNEVGFMTSKNLGTNVLGRFSKTQDIFSNNYHSMVKVLENNGKVQDTSVYHEAFHAYFNNFVSAADRAMILQKVIKNPLAISQKLYSHEAYPTHEARAEEWLADDFAHYIKGPKAYKGFFRNMWEKLLNKLRNLIRKGTNAQKIYEDMVNRKPGSGKVYEGEVHTSRTGKTPTDQVSAKASDFEGDPLEREWTDEYKNQLKAYQEKMSQYEVMKEAHDNHPLKDLEKHVAKSGQNKGLLPSVGEGKSKFAKNGDTVIDALSPYHMSDNQKPLTDEVVQKFNDEYLPKKAQLAKMKTELKADEIRLKEMAKTAAEEIEQARVEKLDEAITHANNGAYPLPVRGGIVAPEVIWSGFNDKAAPFLSRDTMERNLEKIAPDKATAAKLNDFLVNHIRGNELARVKYSNQLKTEIRGKMKDFGIKINSDDDKLTMLFGEGQISITELQSATKNWKNVQKAADYSRGLYDKMLDNWNVMRQAYGYRAVMPVKNYFRHFKEVSEFTKFTGFLTNDSQLPTEISGKTQFFRPGKPFSTAELHRMGSSTKYSTIGGFDNYIDSVSQQMFHIDSIQRGKALINYLEDAAVATKGAPDAVNLPNFMANLREYTQLVAGKSASLDRAIESTLGRPAVKFVQGLEDWFGRNAILGNISAAVSHMIPMVFNVATVEKIPLTKGLMDTVMAPVKGNGSLTHVDGQESSYMVRRYPERYIQKTLFQKEQETLGFVFQTVDQFISRLAVSSKYYEGIGKGLSPEAAMKQADNYTQRVIGDRSIGNLPNIMKTKSLSLLTKFQVEINDNFSVLVHDIPQWGGESKYKWRTASMLLQFAIYSYLFNQLIKNIKGSGKGFDPINIFQTLLGTNDEGAGKTFVDRAKTAGVAALGEMPFSSLFTGQFPVPSAITTIINGNGSMWSKLGSFGVAFNPLGGGVQVKKTVQGIQAYEKGQATDTKGNPTFKINQNLPNAVRAALFGASSFPEKGTYSNSLVQLKDLNSMTSSKDKAFLPKYNEIMQLGATDPDGANAKWDALSDADKATFKRITTSRKAQATISTQRNILPTVQKVMSLIKSGDKAGADKIWEGLDETQQKAFTSVYNKLNQ